LKQRIKSGPSPGLISKKKKIIAIDASASSVTAQGKQQKLCGVAVNCSEIKRGKNAL